VTIRLPGIRAISIATGAALLLGLALTTAPAADAAASPRALVVKPGMGTKGTRSVRVRAVQHALQRRGFRVHRADGRFGRATRLAVRRFQRRAGLRVDGVVGTKTRQALGLTARFTRVQDRREHARRVAVHRRAVARHRAAVRADQRRERATPAPRRTSPDPVAVVPPAAQAAAAATAHPAAKSGAVASGRNGLPGGPDLTAALATLIVIATWLLVRQAPPRAGRPALALGSGGMVPAGAPAGGAERAGRAPVPGGEPRDARSESGGRARFAGAGDPAVRATARTRRDAPAPPRPLGAGAPVIAYVDTTAGVGGRAAKKIERTCARAGWDLIEVVAERGDRRAAERAGLAYAIARIENGDANALVIRDIADLGRRGVGRAALMRRVRSAGAALVTCVPGGTPVIDQRDEQPFRARRGGPRRRGAHDLRRRVPGTTPGVPPLSRERGAS